MRRVTVVVGVVTAAVATALACSFPSVDFAPADQFVDGSFVGPDATSVDSGNNQTVPEGGGVVDANSCIGDPACDCDDDKDPKPSCGGHDCDDFDSRVRSTLKDFVPDLPPAVDGGGDWNCDSKVEREFDSGVQCADVLDGAVRDPAAVKAACENAFGFMTEVGCGETGTFVHCERKNFGDVKCVIVTNPPAEDRVRRCR